MSFSPVDSIDWRIEIEWCGKTWPGLIHRSHSRSIPRSKDGVVLSVNQEISGDKRKYEIIGKYDLIIKSIASNDSGRYLCQNFDQALSMTVVLNVLSKWRDRVTRNSNLDPPHTHVLLGSDEIRSQPCVYGYRARKRERVDFDFNAHASIEPRATNDEHFHFSISTYGHWCRCTTQLWDKREQGRACIGGKNDSEIEADQARTRTH